MPRQKCQKCGKIWNGWAQPAICPDCGAKLEMEKKEERRFGKEKRTGEDRRKLDDPNDKRPERRSGQDRRTGQRRKNEGCKLN